MGKQEVLLCDRQPCDRRPVHTYLVSAPTATVQLDLCNWHQAQLLGPLMLLGRIVGVPSRAEEAKLDELWE